MGARQAAKKRGNVGEQIFAEVQRLTKAEGISRADAFRRIAKESGRTAGTVSVNFYRVANQRGVKLASRGPRKAEANRVGRPARGKGVAAGNAATLLRDLGRLLEQQQKEIDRLRQENARFQEIRRLVK